MTKKLLGRNHNDVRQDNCKNKAESTECGEKHLTEKNLSWRIFILNFSFKLFHLHVFLYPNPLCYLSFFGEIEITEGISIDKP